MVAVCGDDDSSRPAPCSALSTAEIGPERRRKGPIRYADRMYTATVLYVDMSGTISTLYDGLIVPEHFPDV